MRRFLCVYVVAAWLFYLLQMGPLILQAASHMHREQDLRELFLLALNTVLAPALIPLGMGTLALGAGYQQYVSISCVFYSVTQFSLCVAAALFINSRLSATVSAEKWLSVRRSFGIYVVATWLLYIFFMPTMPLLEKLLAPLHFSVVFFYLISVTVTRNGNAIYDLLGLLFYFLLCLAVCRIVYRLWNRPSKPTPTPA